MTEELLQKLIDIVLNTAPELWRIAVRQVIVNGVRNALFFIISMIAIFIFPKVLRRLEEEYRRAKNDPERYHADEEFPYMVGKIFAWVFLGIAVLVAFLTLDATIGYLANPEYYAIKVLFGLVK